MAILSSGMKRRSPGTALGGLDLLEESVHTLRRAPAGTLLCYFTGTVPFVLAALFYWADMSQSGLAEQHLVPGAILLSVLFLWMKLWQSVFALKLSAQLTNHAPPRLNASSWMRAVGTQTLLQSTGLFLIPIAAQILLPLGWVYAFYQNATALGLREPTLAALVRRSWKQALGAPRQNHIILFVLGLFGIFVFLNAAVVLLSAPGLLKMLAGVESPFTLSMASSFNTTFLAAALGLTYLCLDPLVKSAYVLRCFYGEARATGEDLRVALRQLRQPTAALLAALLLTSTTAMAAPSPAPPPDRPAPAQAGELNRSIEEVLKRREYTWRTPRPKKEKDARAEPEMLQRLRQWAKETLQSVFDWVDAFLRKLFGPRGTPGASQFSLTTERLVYVLIAVAVATILVVLWFIWRARRQAYKAGLTATPAAPLPDLESEDVTGEELPFDGWMQLALELLERGELRLAMRAFYFSSLAHLAARQFLSIARFKSNRDYERELRRRSHALPEVSASFSENVSVFDRVWYGTHEINAELLQQFRSNVERIRAC